MTCFGTSANGPAVSARLSGGLGHLSPWAVEAVAELSEVAGRMVVAGNARRITCSPWPRARMLRRHPDDHPVLRETAGDPAAKEARSAKRGH